LTVGVYQDEDGLTSILPVVRAAERILLENEQTKTYLPIDGLHEYDAAVCRLILGQQSPVLSQQRVATAQTPGGTAALRLSGDILFGVLGAKRIWMSQPTWANHPHLFQSAGLQLKYYTYLDRHLTGLDFDGMLDSLEAAERGDAILLHTVCHNPTGVDPSSEHWEQIIEFTLQRQLIPVFDFAYQGFGTGIDEDADPIRRYCDAGGEAIICNSFSKNFGLYAERVGAITAVTRSGNAAQAMLSQFKTAIRAIYSNPPKHGAAIVNIVLNDSRLRPQWETELAQMRDRINWLRHRFVETMQRLVPERNFDFINRQVGMFSYSGLKPEQVQRLKAEQSIYILGSGRINIAGINSENLERLCRAMASL
jgi:aspartate/tyrosine/aromatic aminotransferase